MSATRYDSPLRFLVDSNSACGVQYLVELDTYGGNGMCACPHFRFRLEKIIAQPGAKPSNVTRCVHIMTARDQFIDEVMAAIKSRQKENGTEKKERQHA